MIEIEATQRKLREARFFLSKLILESESSVRNEPEAFAFYLSAFLSADRSVTFVLHKEAKDQYETWFPSWIANQTEAGQKIFNFMRDQRNFEQKEGGAKFSTTWEFIPMIDVKIEHRGHLNYYGFHFFGPPGIPAPQVGRPVHSFQLVGEVTATCRGYLECLEWLVRDFLKTHSS